METNNLEYHTREGVNITQRVKDGKIEIFNDKKQAYKFSKRIGSYHYRVDISKKLVDIFTFENKTKTTFQKIAFGVPK